MGFPSSIKDSHLRRVGRHLLSETAGQVTEAELDELSCPPQDKWPVIKQSAWRTVRAGRLGGQDVYVKHFHRRSPLWRLVEYFRGAGVWGEVSHATYLSRCGVATTEVLAAGCANGRAWLVTRAVAPAEPADQWHLHQLSLGPPGTRAIRQATVALAQMVATMHACGVRHSDLHCGNVLIRTDTAAPQPVLTDLHRARRFRRLSRRGRAINLAQLYHDRQHFTSRSDRLRFLKHYLASSRAGGTLRGWAIMIEGLTRRHTRRRYAKRDRRTGRTNKYFHRLTLPGGWRGHVVLATKHAAAGSPASTLRFQIDDWRAALAQPEALLVGDDAEVAKDTRSSLIVRRHIQVGPHRLCVYVKRSRRKYARRLLTDCFRPSRAVRAFKLGHALLNRRIATALPLAALERRRGPMLLDSILISEAVDGPHVDVFLNRWYAAGPKDDPSPSAAQQRRLARQVPARLGLLARRLHDLGLAHRDLKASNLLVRRSPQDTVEMVLLDLEGLRCTSRITARQRFRGLARLNVSLLECPAVNHAGRLRMLLSYLRRPGCGRIKFKPYWRVLEEWSARKLERKVRSRRKDQKTARRLSP